MAKGFSLSIAADTRSFTTAVKKGIQEPLEDAADILEEIGRDGGRDIGKVEDAARDAQKDTEKLKDEYRKLQQEIRDTGRKAKTDFADPSNRASRDVQADLEEVNREAKANAAEMFSSFDGSFESIADAAQGTLGGLVGGLGGIPAMAGVAAGAAGLGLVSAELIAQGELAEEIKQGLIDAYRAAAEEGSKYIDQAIIDAAALDIIFDTDRRRAAIEDAATIGVDTNTFIQALAGDTQALASVLDVARTKAEELAGKRGGEGLDALSTSLDFIDTGSVGAVINELERLEGIHSENQDAARQYTEYMNQSSAEQREQTARVRAVEQERFDALAARYSGLNGATATIPVSLDTSEAERQLTSLTRRRTITVDVAGQGINGRFGTRVE